MEDGDGSLKSVMSTLDQVYGGTTTYTTLLNKLNSVQQGYDETAKDYYKCVLQIRVKLQEFHAYMFCKGDLEHQTKEAFFNGLRSEYQAMVVHKRDDPMVGTTTCCPLSESVRKTRKITGETAELSMQRRIRLHTHVLPIEMTRMQERCHHRRLPCH